MTKKEKVQFVIDTLNEIYPEIPIPLDHKDPYTLLIAVLLSAQSTDVKVNQITPKLFEIADTPEKMVKLSVEEIREIIKPVGLSPMKRHRSSSTGFVSARCPPLAPIRMRWPRSRPGFFTA